MHYCSQVIATSISFKDGSVTLNLLFVWDSNRYPDVADQFPGCMDRKQLILGSNLIYLNMEGIYKETTALIKKKALRTHRGDLLSILKRHTSSSLTLIPATLGKLIQYTFETASPMRIPDSYRPIYDTFIGNKMPNGFGIFAYINTYRPEDKPKETCVFLSKRYSKEAHTRLAKLVKEMNLFTINDYMSIHNIVLNVDRDTFRREDNKQSTIVFMHTDDVPEDIGVSLTVEPAFFITLVDNEINPKYALQLYPLMERS